MWSVIANENLKLKKWSNASQICFQKVLVTISVPSSLNKHVGRITLQQQAENCFCLAMQIVQGARARECALMHTVHVCARSKNLCAFMENLFHLHLSIGQRL